MIRNKYIVYLIALLAMLFWGMSFVWTKIVLEYYDPITTIFLRLILSAAVLWTGLEVFGRVEKIRKSDYKLFLLSALFNPFFYFLGENWGLVYTSATVTSVIIATIPIFTTIVAWFTVKEKLSSLNIGGIILSFLGIIVMLVNRDLSLNAEPRGIILLFTAVFSAVIYSILIKKLAPKYNAFTIIAVQNLIGIFYFLPLFLIFGFQAFIKVQPNFELVSSLLLLALLCSSLAFVFFTISVKHIGVSRTSVFGNTIPVFTAVFSFIILSEQFNINKIAGIAIVLTGVFLTQMQKGRV